MIYVHHPCDKCGRYFVQIVKVYHAESGGYGGGGTASTVCKECRKR